MLSQILCSGKVGVDAVPLTKLACKVVIMHMKPQLFPSKEVDLAEAAKRMGRGQMGLQLLVIGKHGQLQGKRSLSLQK